MQKKITASKANCQIRSCPKHMSKDFISMKIDGSNLEIFENNISKGEMNSKISSCIKQFREMQKKEN